MNNIEVVLEKFESANHAASDATKYTFWNACSLKFIQGAGIHVLHAIVNTRFDKESAVKFDDFWCNSPMKDVEFHDDGV